jgi:hypothetical protein
MPKKKDKSEELSEQELINRRVDAMLDPRQPDEPVSASSKKDEVPPLDIFKDASPRVAQAAKTAPEVSGKLLDKVDDKIENQSTPRPQKPVKESPEPPEPAPDPPKDPIDQQDPLDDDVTDKAVEDIATKEGNTLLALQDALGRKASRKAGDLAEEDRRAAKRRRWGGFIFLVLFVVFVLLALPLTAYTCRWPVGIRLSVTTDIVPSVCK